MIRKYISDLWNRPGEFRRQRRTFMVLAPVVYPAMAIYAILR